MEEPERTGKEEAARRDAAQGQFTPVGMDGEKQKKDEAAIPHRCEHCPEDDVERWANEFWEWIKREKIPAHRWITALSSIALLAVTFGQLVVACNNYRTSSPLVGYGKQQADAATTFSVSAGKIDQGVAQAVGKLNSQTEATSNVADQTKAQAANMAALNDLGRQIARVAYGAPVLHLNGWMGWFHQPSTKKVWAAIKIQNDGRTDATSIQVAVKLDFLDKPPKIYPTEEQATKPPNLIPSKIIGPVSSGQCPDCLYLPVNYPHDIAQQQYATFEMRTLYVWGTVWYKDFLNETTTYKFCRRLGGKDIFTAAPGDVGTGNYEDCE
jgi:hypothetical protein